MMPGVFLESSRLEKLLGACILALALLACQPVPGDPPAPIPTEVVAEPAGTGLPTEAGSTSIPTATPDLLRFVLPSPGAEPVSAWRPPLYPVPWAPTPLDHFYFSRPIAADEINWPVVDYRYGGILSGLEFTHTGVDIPADAGTVVIAAGAGDVIWTGWGLFSGVRDNHQDPYGLSVMIRHDFGYNSQPLYTVYAHLSKVMVAAGQWVDAGASLGLVGETGHATGPHLHFEVRLGDGSRFTTRNPELWLVPPQGWGILVARIGDLYSNPLDAVRVRVQSVATGRIWDVITYRHEEVNSDEVYRENLVLSDLPAGLYEVRVPYRGTVQSQEVEVLAGQVTFFTFRGFLLFNLEPPFVPGPDGIQFP